MSYLEHVVKALSAIKMTNETREGVVEQLSAAQQAFVTNGSGARLQLESAGRNLDRVIEWAKRSKTQVDEALKDVPPVTRGHLTALDGGKPARRTANTLPGALDHTPTDDHGGAA